MELIRHLFCGLHIIYSVSWFKARQSQPLVLRMTLGVWLVSQHGQSSITNAPFDNGRGLECNLVYQTQEKEPRLMGFYPLDFKKQISKKKANHTLDLKTVCLSEKCGFFVI